MMFSIAKFLVVSCLIDELFVDSLLLVIFLSSLLIYNFLECELSDIEIPIIFRVFIIRIFYI